MKLLYVALGGVDSPGVQKKLLSKIDSLNQAGIETFGLLFSDSGSQVKQKQYETIPMVIKTPKLFLGHFFWRFLYIYNESIRYSRLTKTIRKHQFDYIIFRYPGSNYFLNRFTRRFKNRIVFELNARQLSDHKKDNVHNSFLDKYRIFSERYFFSRVMARSKAILAVTEDILTDEMARAGVNKPSMVLGNGIDLDHVPLRTPPLLNGMTIDMCIAIGSLNSPAYGLDRLAKSIANYHGAYTFRVHIAGTVSNAELAELNALAGTKAFISEGLLDAQSLHRLYSSCHVAFAALAMYRLDASYSSSLKVKDYLASGIPFFLAYTESEVEQIEALKPYYLKYDNADTLLNMDKLVSFVLAYAEHPGHPAIIRAACGNQIDYKYKARMLADFLNTLPPTA